MQQPPVAHVEWSSRLAFILAASGSAVGLGNIWKFPYMAGENGGGAFVLVYRLCVLAVGVPIMIAEILIGRRARLNPMDAMGTLAAQHGRSGVWRWVGLAGVIAGFAGVEHEAGGSNGIPAPIETVGIYGEVFGKIAIVAIISAASLFALAPLLNRWTHSEIQESTD